MEKIIERNEWRDELLGFGKEIFLKWILGLKTKKIPE